MCGSSSAHVTLNLKSCTAKLSQKPSMANLEAAYTSLNTTPRKKGTGFSFRFPTSDSFFHTFIHVSVAASIRLKLVCLSVTCGVFHAPSNISRC